MHNDQRTDVVKKGDSPTLRYRANADLSTATTITLHAAPNAGAVPAFSRAAVFESVDSSGHSVVTVDLTAADTATPRVLLVELEATINGKKHTFPSEGFLRLRIVDDLA